MPSRSDLEEACKYTDLEVHQPQYSIIALNWAVQKEYISTSIVGCQSRKNVEQNAAAFEWTLSSDEIARLDVVINKFIR